MQRVVRIAQSTRTPESTCQPRAHDAAIVLPAAESPMRPFFEAARWNLPPLKRHLYYYEGKRLNSPNDVICLADGALVFTDLPYGLRREDGSFGPQEIPFQGVSRPRRRGNSVAR